jgi:hypothetical protein
MGTCNERVIYPPATSVRCACRPYLLGLIFHTHCVHLSTLVLALCSHSGCCPDCKIPGDDCPLVWGVCSHVFHMHCILKWIQAQQVGVALASTASPHFTSLPPHHFALCSSNGTNPSLFVLPSTADMTQVPSTAAQHDTNPSLFVMPSTAAQQHGCFLTL